MFSLNLFVIDSNLQPLGWKTHNVTQSQQGTFKLEDLEINPNSYFRPHTDKRQMVTLQHWVILGVISTFTYCFLFLQQK